MPQANKTAKAANEIWAWIVKNDLHGDAQLYSADQWKARKERWGRDSLFTIITEGPLYDLLNSYYSHPYADRLRRQLGQIMKKNGVYYELGFAWSMHFYPIPATRRKVARLF